MNDHEPGPCTRKARNQGCTCNMESVNSASIDPPEPVIDMNCPLHGNEAARDPDAARDRRIEDDALNLSSWQEDDGEDF